MRRQLMSKIQGAVAKRWEFEVEVEVGVEEVEVGLRRLGWVGLRRLRLG